MDIEVVINLLNSNWLIHTTEYLYTLIQFRKSGVCFYISRMNQGQQELYNPFYFIFFIRNIKFILIPIYLLLIISSKLFY